LDDWTTDDWTTGRLDDCYRRCGGEVGVEVEYHGLR
jgi:hypothetical protein